MKRAHPTRKCDAPNCNALVPAGKLMCPAHWFALPQPLRRAIVDTWKAKRIADWSANCLEARGFLADRAGRGEGPRR